MKKKISVVLLVIGFIVLYFAYPKYVVDLKGNEHKFVLGPVREGKDFKGHFLKFQFDNDKKLSDIQKTYFYKGLMDTDYYSFEVNVNFNKGQKVYAFISKRLDNTSYISDVSHIKPTDTNYFEGKVKQFYEVSNKKFVVVDFSFNKYYDDKEKIIDFYERHIARNTFNYITLKVYDGNVKIEEISIN